MKDGHFLHLCGHDLDIDIILVEYQYPIFFTCIDEEENMYIATCFYVDSEKKRYLVARTSPSIIKECLVNRRTIRDIFGSNDKTVYVVTFLKGKDEPTIGMAAVSEIDQCGLPTAGIYMDAEEDEFSSEISILDARIKRTNV